MNSKTGNIFRKLSEYKRSALIVFIIWTLVGLFFGAFGVIAVSADNRTASALDIFTDSFVRAYIWGALSPLVYVFALRFMVDPRRLDYRIIAYNLAFGIVLTFAYAWICIGVSRLVNPNYFDVFPSFWIFVKRQVVIFSWYTFISLYTPTFLTIQSLLFLRNYRNEEAKNASLRAELSNAQLTALKMQLHPHFLFNSLHSISSLILLDPKRANTMVALLGDFLRQTLEHSNDQMVTLADELEFLRCYLDIEKTRFDDRLSVNFDVEQGVLDAEVPHLIVQPLVENAVKHGISPYSTPGHIEITAKREGDVLLLRVKNSGGGTPGTPAGTRENGLGLLNVESRLKNIYGDNAGFSVVDLGEKGFAAELTIPFSVNGSGNNKQAEYE